MAYGWNTKPTKAKFKHHIGHGEGEPRDDVWEIGRYSITVAADRSVTFWEPRRDHRAHDPRATFPNIEVDDDDIRIPITDIVDTILTRLDPRDLARALWDNEDVKAEFMECLVERYNLEGIDDNDRRKFLAGVKVAIHDRALDDAVTLLQSQEHQFARDHNFVNQVHRTNDMLREMDVRKDDGSLLQINWNLNDGIMRIGGEAWEKARDDWRKEILARFPAPISVSVREAIQRLIDEMAEAYFPDEDTAEWIDEIATNLVKILKDVP